MRQSLTETLAKQAVRTSSKRAIKASVDGVASKGSLGNKMLMATLTAALSHFISKKL